MTAPATMQSDDVGVRPHKWGYLPLAGERSGAYD
jgi:hypothetical protein